MILDMLEEHELTSVLNQLPPNAFDELFTGKLSLIIVLKTFEGI